MAEPTIQELDRRVATIEGWKEAQEKVFLGFKEDLQDIKGRITGLKQKVDLQFRWLVGIQLTVLVAIVAALLGVVLRG